jgi:hypothetical protein
MVAPQQATLAVDEYLKLIHAPFIHPGMSVVRVFGTNCGLN